jgi:hypothetical protein
MLRNCWAIWSAMSDFDAAVFRQCPLIASFPSPARGASPRMPGVPKKLTPLNLTDGFIGFASLVTGAPRDHTFHSFVQISTRSRAAKNIPVYQRTRGRHICLRLVSEGDFIPSSRGSANGDMEISDRQFMPKTDERVTNRLAMLTIFMSGVTNRSQSMNWLARFRANRTFFPSVV